MSLETVFQCQLHSKFWPLEHLILASEKHCKIQIMTAEIGVCTAPMAWKWSILSEAIRASQAKLRSSRRAAANPPQATARPRTAAAWPKDEDGPSIRQRRLMTAPPIRRQVMCGRAAQLFASRRRNLDELKFGCLQNKLVIHTRTLNAHAGTTERRRDSARRRWDCRPVSPIYTPCFK